MSTEMLKRCCDAGLIRGMLYAAAARRRAEDKGWRPQESVRLPGLENPSSQLGVPLVVRGELLGVDPEHAVAGSGRGAGGRAGGDG